MIERDLRPVKIVRDDVIVEITDVMTRTCRRCWKLKLKTEFRGPRRPLCKACEDRDQRSLR